MLASAPIEIDYDPWSTANNINPTTNAFITVGVKTLSIADGDAVDFDAADVDPETVRLGVAGAPLAAAVLTNDIDADGDTDYIFGFRTQATGITCLDNQIVFAGQTYDGVPFAAVDTVNADDACFTEVEIDVEPFDPANRVYPDDEYIVQVSIRDMDTNSGDPVDFDASRGNQDNVRFGPNRAKSAIDQIDYNNGTQRIFGFQMQDTGIVCADTEVELVGLASPLYQQPDFPTPAFRGSASIDTRDCDTGCHP